MMGRMVRYTAPVDKGAVQQSVLDMRDTNSAYKLRMDENEQNVSKEADEDKLLLEKSKLELEAEKAKDDKLIRILTTVTSVGVTIAGFAVGSHWYGKGFKFEETGTICSSTFKGLMKDFRFFRK